MVNLEKEGMMIIVKSMLVIIIVIIIISIIMYKTNVSRRQITSGKQSDIMEETTKDFLSIAEGLLGRNEWAETEPEVELML